MKLVSEALFNKLLGSQHEEESKIIHARESVTENVEIPDEIKAVLYRGYTRQLQDHHKHEESKPLLVKNVSEQLAPVATTSSSSGSSRQRTTTTTTATASAQTTQTGDVPTPLKGLDPRMTKITKLLQQLGFSWNAAMDVIYKGQNLDCHILPIVQALSHLKYFNTAIPGLNYVINVLRTTDLDPNEYFKPPIIEKIFTDDSLLTDDEEEEDLFTDDSASSNTNQDGSGLGRARHIRKLNQSGSGRGKYALIKRWEMF